MAKLKGKKGPSGGVNSHVRARINFLYNASTFLQSARQKLEAVEHAVHPPEDEVMTDSIRDEPQASVNSAISRDHLNCVPALARTYLSQMRGVSLKCQLRLPIEQKRSFCKRCDTLLIPGDNCTEEIRNPSRRARKPWAEVRVVRCNTCGTEKRFPRTDRRSSKLSERKKQQAAIPKPDSTKPT
ncbi:RNAse P Rpr2/Rpp21/SNM1 subunit domain-containing protein [Aspergillus granulosus]|uniref:RNAse P Rpr2/Rpp21/SNM1 subunit domain-containing protein n=1 Tax=Aspergillus granulosus TaxID=176169 RepID=A0ABR4HX16_9EURO